jgi:arsenate reductase
MNVMLARRLFAEFLGTALLLCAVVGSGIAAQRLSPNDVGLQLLENSIATAAALVAIILAFGPISGAHLNPVITLTDRFFGGLTSGQAAAYVAAQILGAAAGTITANLMFSLPAAQWSTRPRSSPSLWLGEAVATFGLVLVIFGIVRSARPATVPFAVGAYIGAACWFTSSTSFANPAATLARSLTDTFTGIDLESVLPFIGAELLGAVLAVAAIAVLYPRVQDSAPAVVPPHPTERVSSETGP